MKAQFVNENISFERGGNPLSRMGLGGFSFDTLQRGAILEVTKYFGVTQSSGQITGYHSGKISMRKGNLLLVTNVGVPYNNNVKTFHFTGGLEKEIYKARETMREGEIPFILWGSKGFIEGISKRRFDYRFKIIESGFHKLSEAKTFDRDDPDIYRKIGIGKKTWRNLKPGDILIPKKEVHVDRGTFYPPSRLTGWKIWQESVVVIEKVSYAKVATKNGYATDGIRMQVFQAWDLDAASEYIHSKFPGDYGPDSGEFIGKPDRLVAGSVKQWENRFDIYEGEDS